MTLKVTSFPHLIAHLSLSFLTIILTELVCSDAVITASLPAARVTATAHTCHGHCRTVNFGHECFFDT